MFKHIPASRVALEAGTHSPWVSRHVRGLRHEVIVANPRNVAWITKSRNKNDGIDAEKLARMARVDVKLLAPIRHRGEQAQRDLALLRARAKLINAARGLVKSLGERLKCCSSEQVNVELAESLSEATRPLVLPLLQAVAQLSEQIEAYEQQIAAMAERYPQIGLLTPVHGVGDLTALLYVLTLEDPARLPAAGTWERSWGSKRGRISPEPGSATGDQQAGRPASALDITAIRAVHSMAGISRQRFAAVGVGQAGAASQTTSWQKGKNKNGKKRVLVALARRLAVLLHQLWVNGEVYDPLYQAKQGSAAAA